MPGFRNRSWGCVIAAVLFACKPGAASAQTPASSGPDDLVGGATPERFLFYSGFDLWNFGYAGYAGARWAPDSLNSDGFVLNAFISDGIERFDTPTTRYRTAIFRASILPGWRFKRGNLEVKMFAGPDFEYDVFSPMQAYRLPHRSSAARGLRSSYGGSPPRSRCCRRPPRSRPLPAATAHELQVAGACLMPAGSVRKSQCRRIASASSIASAHISPACKQAHSNGRSPPAMCRTAFGATECMAASAC